MSSKAKPPHPVAGLFRFGGNFFREVFLGLRNYCEDDPRLDLMRVGGSPLLTVEIVAKTEVEGIVSSMGPGEVDFVLGRRIPAVRTSNRVRHGWLPAVLNDDLAVGRMAADFLGHRPVRDFLCFYHGGLWHEAERCLGFRRRLAVMGRPCKVRRLDGKEIRVYPDLFNGLEQHLQLIRDALQGLDRPAAVYCPRDDIAMTVLEAAHLLGISVPGELLVLGTDNDPHVHDICRIPLSTIALSGRRIGYTAGEMLAGMLAGKAPPKQALLIPPQQILERRSTGHASADTPTIDKTMRILSGVLRQNIQIDDLARQVGMSRRSLEVVFRKHTGQSPYEHLLRLRFERAAYLLEHTHQPISQVAEEAGFGDMRHMGVFFRRRLGISPRDFRRIMR